MCDTQTLTVSSAYPNPSRHGFPPPPSFFSRHLSWTFVWFNVMRDVKADTCCYFLFVPLCVNAKRKSIYGFTFASFNGHYFPTKVEQVWELSQYSDSFMCSKPFLFLQKLHTAALKWFSFYAITYFMLNTFAWLSLLCKNKFSLWH